MFALGSRIIGIAKTTCMDIQARFSAVLKVSKVVKWSRIFVRLAKFFSRSGVGGKSVRQADVSGGTHFPRKLCPTGQDILSVLG